jgi:lipoprotein Spr/probable lipoprotein NlpC
MIAVSVLYPPWVEAARQVSKKQPKVFYEEDVKKGLKKYLGIPYELGGFSNEGIDCSGFVRHAYKKIFGIDLPHNSREQSSFPGLVKITGRGLRTGDLLFFSSSPRSKNISHVGVYLSGDRFIHSQGKKGVIISTLDGSYWKPRLKAAKRLAGVEIRPKGSDKALASASWDLALTQRSDLLLDLTTFRKYHDTEPGHPLQGLPTWARKTDDIWLPSLQSFQLGYTFNAESWSIGIAAFRDEVPMNIPWHLKRYEPIIGIAPMDMGMETYRREGFRLGGRFLTEEGVTLSPSFGMLRYMDLPEKFALQRRALDVGLELSSEASGWSLAADLIYSDNKGTADNLFNEQDGRVSVDMSLTLRHQVTDQIGLSLTGQRTLTTDPSETDEASGIPGIAQKSLFFKLDLRY